MPPIDGATSDFADAFDIEARRRYAAFLDGVEAYRRHWWNHRPAPPPVVWRQGSSCLRDYGAHGDGDRPVLVVPSLINRAYILDLTHEGSFLRSMSRRGFRPFLMDWGTPTAEETRFTLTDYITRRLIPAAEVVGEHSGRPAVVMGYCMGGLLALALCLLRPDVCCGYAALASPWDFHAEPSLPMRLLRLMGPAMARAIRQVGYLPVDTIQAMVCSIDPQAVARKFSSFGRSPQASAQARRFVALEDWLNDGVNLAAPVAETCIVDWYGANTTARKLWTVAGRIMKPERLARPSLCVIPLKDRLVPTASADGLARALPNPTVLRVPFGHIGLITARSAPNQVHSSIFRWMKDL